MNPVRPHDTLGYYAKLNVGVDCTQEEIKRQYRQLVRFYHPDKIEQVRALIGEHHNTNHTQDNLDHENQQNEAEDDQEYGVTEAKQGLASSSGLDGAATRSFAKLQEAYETLSDPVARAVYDTYGGDGLAAGRDVVAVDESAPSSLRRVRERMERTRMREEILREIRDKGVPEQYGRVRYSGLYHVSLSRPGRREGLASLLDPLEVGVVSLNSNATVRATEKDIVTLGGQMGQSMTQGNSQGSLTLSVRREQTAQHTLEAACACQLDPGRPAGFHTSFKSTRQLSANHTASLDLSCSSQREDDSGYTHQAELEVGSTRRLGERLYGEFAWTFDPHNTQSGCRLTFTGQRKNRAWAFDTYAGKVMGFSGQGTALLPLPGGGKRSAEEEEEEVPRAKTFVGKCAFKARTDALDLEVSASRKDPGTQVSLGWGAAISHRGLFWRLRAGHLGQRFFVPVCLSTQVTALPALAATFTLPPILCWLGSYLVPPARRLLERLQGPGAREVEQAELEAGFRGAAGDCVLMAGPALRKRKAASKDGGLVVVRAVYGDLDAFRSEEAGGGALGRRGDALRWLDVTLPVQFLCKGNKILIHGGASKQHLMGFCRVDAEEPRLLVRYLHEGECHECVVSDTGTLAAPSGADVVEDPAVASAARGRALEMEGEAAEDLVRALIREGGAKAGE